MKFKLSDVWQAILGYLIYKFESKSIEVEDPIISMLRMQLENANKREKQLLEIIANYQNPPTREVNEVPTDFKPLGREPWWIQAKRKTAESIERRKELEREWEANRKLKAEIKEQISNPNATQSIESLEAELAIGDTNA